MKTMKTNQSMKIANGAYDGQSIETEQWEWLTTKKQPGLNRNQENAIIYNPIARLA
jgi:hypothetical protein